MRCSAVPHLLSASAMPPFRLGVFLVSLVFLAGCAVLTPRADEGPPTIASSGDLVEYLGARGYVLRPRRLTSPFALRAVGHEYRVEGGLIRIYEFESPEMAAEEGVPDFLIDTYGGRTSSVFQHGPLVVAYVGDGAAVQVALAQALGPAVY